MSELGGEVNFGKGQSNLEHRLCPWRHCSFCRSISKRNILDLSNFRRVYAAPPRRDGGVYFGLMPVVIHLDL